MKARVSLLAAAILLSLRVVAHARDVPVATAAGLRDAIATAMPGDQIIVADGSYGLTDISCVTPGTGAAPIIVRAATPLGAKLEFSGVEGFKVSGAHWQFDGLDIRGVCPVDDNCEHAFHVVGNADGFVLRNSRVRDFNAQLKVNIATVNAMIVAPNAGLIEYNELSDTRPRNTGNPVTKLNIDGGDDWIIRGNYIHDATKMGGNQTSYGAFLKSGGKRGVMERNLMICAKDDQSASTRIGLSLGGGGTDGAFCPPAYNANVPCAIEHDGGTLRNNVIINCSDVGIYLNRAKDSKIVFNTLIATSGIDFRFDTTSGEAYGNLVSGVIRARDGATMTATSNVQNVALATFQTWYTAPLVGDLTAIGDVVTAIGAVATRAEVTDDYCANLRSAGMTTTGAIDHLIGGCVATRPPTGPGGVAPRDVNLGGRDDIAPTVDDGGGCCKAQRDPLTAWLAALVLMVLVVVGRKRSSRCDRAVPPET